MMIQKGVQKQHVTAVSEKRIKIVKKAKYDEGKSMKNSKMNLATF
ncbi:hypothetical protein QLH62_03460 [Streptococcus iniae]|nr:hypothetical protein [Streptococcus iniae]WHL24195.1 hypothetical protein QLH62_03460 [Streptococcus iniae]